MKKFVIFSILAMAALPALAQTSASSLLGGSSGMDSFLASKRAGNPAAAALSAPAAMPQPTQLPAAMPQPAAAMPQPAVAGPSCPMGEELNSLPGGLKTGFSVGQSITYNGVNATVTFVSSDKSWYCVRM
jgi:hypothetical protein